MPSDLQPAPRARMLLALIIVSLTVIWLRQTPPDIPRGFRVRRRFRLRLSLSGSERGVSRV